jgi:hypothetical protein
MHSEADWAAATQKFQQSLHESWGKAMQSFEQLGLPGSGNGTGNGNAAAIPALTFSAQKLQDLQRAYVKEATELWNHGLQPRHRRRSACRPAMPGAPIPWPRSLPRPTCSTRAP